MTQHPGRQLAYQRTPLSPEETARAEVNLAPDIAEALMTRGRCRVTADTPEMVELFRKVARRVSDMLRRPVVSYASGRDIVFSFGHEASGLAGQGARPLED